MAKLVNQITRGTIGGIDCAWDQRLQTLTVRRKSFRMHVDLTTSDRFEHWFRHLSKKDRGSLMEALGSIASGLAIECEDDLDPIICAGLSVFVRHLLWRVERRPRLSDLSAAGATIAEMLPSRSIEQAWQVAYRSRMPAARRHALLRTAVAVLEGGDSNGAQEVRWWTARVCFLHAVAWYDHGRAGEAKAALIEAAAAYRRLLMESSSPRALEAFLRLSSTTTDAEVMLVVRQRQKIESLTDIDARLVGSWFLRRYDVFRAASICTKTLESGEVVAAGLAGVCLIFAATLFIRQSFFAAQVALQALALVIVVVGSPRLFGLMMPRALFGSLVAWLTVILAETANELPISRDLAVREARRASHEWLSMNPAWADVYTRRDFAHALTMLRLDATYVLLFTLCVVIAISFLSIELSGRLFVRGHRRSVLCFGIMFAGALYWGAILAPAIHLILTERPAPALGCACLLPSWLFGSALAVDFGLLIQLIWDDKNVAEPLGSVTAVP